MINTLCLDCGNTRLKAAIFHGDQMIQERVLTDGSPETITGLLQEFEPQRSILASVINHDPEIESLLDNQTKFHKLSALTKLNFSTPVGKPETIGADRLALAAAAVHFFPGRNNLIIGLGSCITYNFINQYHQFLGGNISPGMDMRFRAMHEFTAKLPLVQAEWNIPLLGYDTKTNMQSGVILGMAGEIDGMIERYAARFGNFNVVLTGGNSAYFASLLKNRIFADFNFLFKGLYAISEINQ
ncbi:MAG TPA: type III pantothenate kinase [Chitinophagaceae bacterium]|nr:type III pantothenate kinase [Chitinophagaceae bacterium]